MFSIHYTQLSDISDIEFKARKEAEHQNRSDNHQTSGKLQLQMPSMMSLANNLTDHSNIWSIGKYIVNEITKIQSIGKYF